MQSFSTRSSVPASIRFLNVFRNLSRSGYARVPAVVHDDELHGGLGDWGGQRLPRRVAHIEPAERGVAE